ncbi:50S ribosomal protein L18e [Candidatus Woesearchaeota archaeon]|nr:50S ribosomal protein L18e [Candidatus Woesearchaeota archaeon]
MRKHNITNEHLAGLIRDLQRVGRLNNCSLWTRIAEDLALPSRQRREVNLSKIALVAKDKETVIVPGKVLASGDLTKPITVAAFSFSEQAKEKIKQANGSILSIQQLVEKNPSGKGVRIIG